MLCAVFRFAVFALGNSSYPHFCGFGKWIDNSLAELSASRMIPIGLGDELGDREGEFRKWCYSVKSQLCSDAKVSPLARMKSLNKAQVQDDLGHVARWKDKKENDSKDFKTLVQSLKQQHGTPIISVKLVSRKNLGQSHGETILVRLEAPKGELFYEPGDHIAVYPVNNDIDVDLILAHLSGLPFDPTHTIVQLQVA